MLDLESIKNSADLLAICGHDTQLKRVAATGGGEYAGACPFCGGQDRFRVNPYASPGRWLCRNCTGGKWQDVIAYIARRDNLDPKKYQDLQEICKRAGGGDLPTTRAPRITPARPAYESPGDQWQAAAQEVITQCQGQLWQNEGAKALEYLKKRGFSEKTINKFNLGYSTGKNIAGLWVARGVVIPCSVKGRVWYLKIRLPAAEGGQKYTAVKGSKPSAIFNADKLFGSDIALFCEGEFDCMIAYQELFDVIPVATLGSATNTPDLATWGAYLRPIKTIYSAYDHDKAGETGAARIMDLAGDRVKLAPLPEGYKDINDYYSAGGDLWQWIKPYISGI